MNAFQYVLTSAQLTKHYEIVQFLTQHPNERYTLAQLDTLLPHGVALQRFPEEWFDLIADGACWHRSIELQRPPPQPPGYVNSEEEASTSSFTVNENTSNGDTAASQRAGAAASVLEASAASARTQAARRLLYVLSCVRAEIRTLAELRSRLESPSTLLDAEGCVALHTDQILIDPRLILQAQRTGLVYYFPDTYDRNAYRRFGMKETTAGSPTGTDGSGGGGRGRAGQATSALLDTFASQEEAERTVPSSSSAGDSAGGRRDVAFLSLPSGVRVQHHLLTRRGVPEQEAHCIPTRLYVGERLRLIVDNATAVRELGADGDLRVDMVMRGVRPSKSDPTVVGPSGQQMFNALQTEPPPPLRIRRETQSVRHAVATAGAVSAGMSGSGAPAPMQPPAPVLVSATTKVELEAMYPCTLTLMLTVNNVENLLPMEVMEETAAMPGVLILRDRQLDSFSLSQKDALPDVLVNPPVTAEYPFQSIDPAAQAATSAAWAELVPLPWTQNPSPAVLSLRDATYPAQHTTLQAATRAVFSAQSLADEARVRLTIARLRREAARKESAGGKRRVSRFRNDLVLSNRHLLHFGFNFSIPFMPPPQ